MLKLLYCATRLHISYIRYIIFLIKHLGNMRHLFLFSLRTDVMRLAADVTRLALEMLFVLTVVPKAQLALCEEVQLPSGEQQKGMRYSSY